MPACVRRALSHAGESPTVTPRMTVRRVARAQVGGGDLDGERLVGRGAAQHRRSGGGRRRQLEPRRRRHLAGDAVDAEAVRPVRGELELEHRLAHRQVVLQRRADDPFVGQDHDAGALLLVAELLLAHHHAVALDAAEVGLLELEAVLERGTGQRHGDGVAGPEVVGAADDLPHAAVGLADLDCAQAELVGVGMLVSGEHLAHHEAARFSGSRGAPTQSMPSTSVPDIVSSSASSSTVPRQSTYSLIQLNGTRMVSAPSQNCRRKRTSLS